MGNKTSYRTNNHTKHSSTLKITSTNSNGHRYFDTADEIDYKRQLHGSPRFRRKQTKQSYFDKKAKHHQQQQKKSQTVSSYLNVSLQSIGDRTVSFFSRSFNFLHRDSGDTRHSTNGYLKHQHRPPSYRNTSRRKYQTSSLRNPYRRSNTNFPVRGHEALFLPEFSIKGKITEADFEVIDIIARGAFGNVIQVCSLNDNKIYAMKIMSKSQIVRDNAVQQVKDEVTIAQSCLTHPFIVHTYFYWQSRRYLYIITDYVQNGELLSLWLRIRRFPELIVKIYIAQVSLVLDYLHQKGIIYRDVKMENILLDVEGNIKIIDFGLSKWLPQGSRTTTICGTLQYIAPEVLSVRPYDHRVDWYSLGILMYACLFGEYPVSATKDHITMANKVLSHSFHIPYLGATRKDHHPYYKDLLLQLLHKDPNQRLCNLETFRETPYMSTLDFDRVYTKYYSPIKLLCQLKPEWTHEIETLYHIQQPRTNGNYTEDNDDFYISQLSSSPSRSISPGYHQLNGDSRNCSQYQNVQELFQKFST
ncbi:unnamed protein product [Didymodactylos carnosus]|uniref:Protein kinase domain-containing protein n=1 Tax=Didymodactylos carnosus TaxID=1234261 RepID=A0A814GWL2_9BILA|nr:unnamed protein product [Didymodactylos carnosus]CAF1001685.1 unnamed protein product [Didymodactylos carnosus]CAF3524659.1 unnamed protein product [Didymodactylos carnosus]CAF3773064.1 unnamed protein product [Didymodactylos carnosus]